MKIHGKLTIELEDYEAIKKELDQRKKTNDRLRVKVKEVLEASKELSGFFSFVAGKVDTMDSLVSTFNQESTTCEILKTEDNKYKIKLNMTNEEEEDRG